MYPPHQRRQNVSTLTPVLARAYISKHREMLKDFPQPPLPYSSLYLGKYEHEFSYEEMQDI